MNLLEFNKKFPTEQSCKNHIKNLREQRGITCKNCKTQTKHYWLEKIEKFQCSVCNSRTNLKSGTIMEKSQIPFKTWFMCIHLMTSIKKSFSALELQRQLGLKRYAPVWYMMSKIRKSMGSRDSSYKLKGDIELDDSFFTVVDLPPLKERRENIIIKGMKLKRGRGSEKQQEVMVIVESKPVKQDNPNKKKRQLGYVKMIVMDQLTNVGINYEINKNVEENSHIISDKYRGYSKLKNIIKQHTPMNVPPKQSMEKLPWVHTVISNVKRQLLGVHHSIGKNYLQNYLNEFCYKLNRRNFQSDLFDRMMIAGVDNR